MLLHFDASTLQSRMLALRSWANAGATVIATRMNAVGRHFQPITMSHLSRVLDDTSVQQSRGSLVSMSQKICLFCSPRTAFDFKRLLAPCKQGWVAFCR